MAAIAKLRLDNDAEMTVLQIKYQLNQGLMVITASIV